MIASKVKKVPNITSYGALSFLQLVLKVAPYCPEHENIKIHEILCIILDKNNEKGRILAILRGSFQMIPVRGLFFGLASSFNWLILLYFSYFRNFYVFIEFSTRKGVE